MWSPAPTDALNCNIALLRVCSVYWPTFCISDIYDGDGAGWRASASSCCLLKKCSRMWSPPPPPAARRGETSSALKRSIRRFVITEKAPRDHEVNTRLAQCLNSVLNVKAVVAPFNQEKALVGAFSVITNLRMDLRFKLQQRVSKGDLDPVSEIADPTIFVTLFARCRHISNIRHACHGN